MRNLNQVRSEILDLCTTSDMKPGEAIAKLGPFDDLDDDSRETVIAAGFNVLIANDFNWLRSHPIEDDVETDAAADGVRSYLGRFQLRPGPGGTARGIYANLSARYETADGKHRPLYQFTVEDWQHNAAREANILKGATTRMELWVQGEAELAASGKSRTSQLPRSVLASLNELAGRALR